MKPADPPGDRAAIPSEASFVSGLLHRWRGGWARVEAVLVLLDSGTCDPVTERLRALESRVADLEAGHSSRVPSNRI